MSPRRLAPALALPLVALVAAPSSGATCTGAGSAEAQVLRVTPPQGLPEFTQSTATAEQTGPGTDRASAGATTTRYTVPGPLPVEVVLGTASATATATSDSGQGSSGAATQIAGFSVLVPSTPVSPQVQILGTALRTEASSSRTGTRQWSSAEHLVVHVDGTPVPLVLPSPLVGSLDLGVVTLDIATSSSSGDVPAAGDAPATASATLLRLKVDDDLGGAEVVLGHAESTSSCT